MSSKPQSFEETLVLYEKMIKNQIKKLKIYQNFDDYYQEGMIGLWDAYRKFDEEKGVFPAYALLTVRGAILTKLKKEHRYKERNQALDTSTIDLFEGAHDLVLQRETFEHYAVHLSPRQKRVIWSRFYEDKDFEDMAQTENVPLSTIRSTYRYGLQKLRMISQKE